jgi:hypothetical protein
MHYSVCQGFQQRKFWISISETWHCHHCSAFCCLIEKQNVTLLDIHTLARVKKTLWRHSDRCIFLWTRQPARLPKGTRWTHVAALSGSPHPPQTGGLHSRLSQQTSYPSRHLMPFSLPHFWTLPHKVWCLWSAPPLRVLPSHDWKPLGFYHLRLDHLASGRLSQSSYWTWPWIMPPRDTPR